MQVTQAPTGWSPCQKLLFGLLALLVLLAAQRLRTHGEPPFRDIPTYALMAREWLADRPLYLDLWDLKPPAIFYTYAIAQLLFGFTALHITFLSWLGAALTCTAITWAAYYRRRWQTALLAGSIYAIASMSLPLQANEPNTELFMNPCLAAAFGCLLRLHGKHAVRYAAAAGLLLGLASLFKTVALAHAIAFGCAVLVSGIAAGKLSLRIRHVCLMAAMAILPWVIIYYLFRANGTWSAFYEAVFTYNRYYAALAGNTLLDNLREGLHPYYLLPRFALVLMPILFLLALGLALGRPWPIRMRWPLVALLSYIVATQVAVSLPGQFAPHYYQLWFPPLAIGAAWAISLWRRRLPRFQWLPAGALLLALVAIELPSYRLSAHESARRKYGTDPIYEERLGLLLREKILQPGEQVYQWGSALTLLYTVDRPLPSGIFFIAPALRGPLQKQTTERLIADLERTRPAFVVVDKQNVPANANQRIADYFFLRYLPVGPDRFSQRFILLARKDSPAAMRRAQIAAVLRSGK